MAGDRSTAGKAGARRRSSRWSPIERELRVRVGPLLAGVDEVGRGPLAGPVVACAVVMPPDVRAIAGVDDSKRLSCTERVRLAARIRERALAVGVGAASTREIDRLNIYHATVLAMRRALARLSLTPDHVLVDGVPLRTLGIVHTAIVGGDDRCYSIACASIVAKVTRDRLMERLAERHPHYAWQRNAGYGTPAHWAGLNLHGPTAHHRRSFCRIGSMQLDLALTDAAAPDDAIDAVAHDLGAPLAADTAPHEGGDGRDAFDAAEAPPDHEDEMHIRHAAPATARDRTDDHDDEASQAPR